MNKIVIIVIPIVLVGTVLGLGFGGVINIPGVTPAKKISKSKTSDSKTSVKAPQGSTTPIAQTNLTPPPVNSSKVPVASQSIATHNVAGNESATNQPSTSSSTSGDMDSGAKKIASIWGNMDPSTVVKMMSDYPPKMSALILSKMDEANVAKIFELMPPKQAASLSKIIEKEAAIAAAKNESSPPTG